MNWKPLLISLGKTLLHAAGGAIAAAGLAWISSNMPTLVAHLNPATGAIIGSVVSSVISAYMKQPYKS
jgi:hypothetical protein